MFVHLSAGMEVELRSQAIAKEEEKLIILIMTWGETSNKFTLALCLEIRDGEIKESFFNISNQQRTQQAEFERRRKSCWEIYGFRVRDKKAFLCSFQRGLVNIFSVDFFRLFVFPDSCDIKNRTRTLVAQQIWTCEGKIIPISLLFWDLKATSEMLWVHTTLNRGPHIILNQFFFKADFGNFIYVFCSWISFSIVHSFNGFLFVFTADVWLWLFNELRNSKILIWL